MITRRTTIFFVLSIVLCGVVAYQARQEARPCREWKQAHPNYVEPPAQREPDGSLIVWFSPCDVLSESTVFERVTVFSAFAIVVTFWILLLRDIVRALKKRFRREP